MLGLFFLAADFDKSAKQLAPPSASAEAVSAIDFKNPLRVLSLVFGITTVVVCIVHFSLLLSFDLQCYVFFSQ